MEALEEGWVDTVGRTYAKRPGRPRTPGITADVGTNEYYRQRYNLDVERSRSLARNRAWRSQLSRFGLTEEQFAELAALGCSVCGASHGGVRDGREKRLHIDHDHETEEFRGLLCTNCNTTLGLVDDDVDRLLALAMYLERTK